MESFPIRKRWAVVCSISFLSIKIDKRKLLNFSTLRSNIQGKTFLLLNKSWLLVIKLDWIISDNGNAKEVCKINSFSIFPHFLLAKMFTIRCLVWSLSVPTWKRAVMSSRTSWNISIRWVDFKLNFLLHLDGNYSIKFESEIQSPDEIVQNVASLVFFFNLEPWVKTKTKLSSHKVLVHCSISLLLSFSTHQSSSSSLHNENIFDYATTLLHVDLCASFTHGK